MKRSYFIAGGILLVIALWMLSGLFIGNKKSSMPASTAGNSSVTRVQVMHSRAQPVLREVVVQGQSLAKREVTLKTEVAGEIAKVEARKGRAVKQGDVLLRLSADDRPQRLEQARALVQQRQLEYEAARSLKQKGLQAERQLAEALSLLRAAKLQLKGAELDMQRLTIRAPFSGVLQTRLVEQGDYLQPGDPLAVLVDLDPLVVRGDVSESKVGGLQTGMAATAELSNGTKLTGAISYVSPVADSRTRTFAIEMEASNPSPHHPGGMSATMRVPLASESAHKVSPALLSLNDAGVLGLKSVDQKGIVRFHEVEIIKSERDGLWLVGLPDEIDLISVGQGFVRAGEQVDVERGQ